MINYEWKLFELVFYFWIFVDGYDYIYKRMGRV